MNEILSLRYSCLLILANLFLESVGSLIPAAPIQGEAVPQEDVASLLQFR